MNYGTKRGDFLGQDAEILGDPYSKKSPLPSIGDSRLSVTPRIPGYRLLGLPQLLQQHTTHNNHHTMAP